MVNRERIKEDVRRIFLSSALTPINFFQLCREISTREFLDESLVVEASETLFDLGLLRHVGEARCQLDFDQMIRNAQIVQQIKQIPELF